MYGTVYERELKRILGGEPGYVKAYARSLPAESASSVEKLLEMPFLVVRAAGSLGIDLIATRSRFSFPIEVKSSSSAVIRFSSGESRLSRQAMSMKEKCIRAGLLPIYAYRFKGAKRLEAWRVYRLETDRLDGLQSVLQSRIPAVGSGKHDNYEMRWENGMPLSGFIGLIFYLESL